MGTDITRIFHSIKELIGEGPPLQTHDWEAEKDVERFLNVASDFLLALSSDVLPVAMFWDDLQWIDGGSLKLLERTMPKLKSSHLLFLGAYRDTHVGPEHPLTAFLSVWRNTVKEQKLHGLLDQDVETLLREVVTLPTHHTKEVARIVTENTAGNPFFILETVKALVQSDALAVHGERLTVEVLKTSGLTAASGVDQVILKRLRNLSPSARDILRCAAVIGRHFTFDVLVQLRQDGKLVLESIEEGIQKHIITQRDGTGLDRGYSFVHDKILETLYNEIEAVDRRYLHQQIGEALETLLQHDGKEAGHPLDIYSDASIFELALHFRLGEDTRKAMKYCLKAARLAQRTYANAEAVQSYEAVLKLLEAGHPLPEEDTEGKSQEECTLTIRESLGDAYAMLGRYGNAEAKYLEIRPSFQHPEKALALCRLETKLGTVSFKQGDREKTLAHFGTALQALGITQPTTTFGVVLNLLTETCKQVFKRFIKPRPCTPTDIEAFRLFELLINYYYFIDMKRCFQVHMKHLNLAEQTASEAYCRVAYGLHQNLCNAAALHGRALKYAEKSMALMRSLEERNAPDAYGLAILDSSVSALGRAYFYTAQYDKAVHYLDAAGEETLKRGNFWDTEVAYGMLCMAYFGQGQFDSMLKCAKALHRIAEGVKDVRGLGWAYVLQALVYSHQGRLSEALDYARRAAKHTRKVGDQLIRIMSLRVLGQVYLKSGKINHAIRALELSRAVILKYQILHDFITGTFVILGEAYSEASAITPARRSHFLKRAGRALWIGRLLARLFPNWRSHALRASGSYELKRGREANALRFLHQSIAEAERLGSRYDEAMAKMLLGRALARKHDSQASVYLERAQTLMTEMGSLSELGEQGVAPLAATEGPRAQELPRYDQDTLKITREFESLLKVCQEISILQDVGNLLEHILEAATEVVCAERGYLLLNENGHLKVKIVKGLDVEEYHTEAFRFSRGLIDQVASSRKPILTTDAQIDPRLTEHKSIHRYGLRSILCVPLLRRNNLLGILYLDNRLLANLFNERHLELISAFAGQAAIAIENASSYHELELEKLKLESLTRSLDQTILEKTTDLRQTNEQLQEANARLQELDQAKTMFISVVSHELRTPLTSIRCYLDNLLAGIVGPLSEKQTYYIQRSAHNLDRLTVMVNDLLDLSRIESGHVHLHLAPLQVPDIVMDVVENLRPTAEAKRIRLEANHDGPPVMVNADRDKFHQVLNNLIGNALKFTPPEGTIEVRSQQDGNCVTFCVSDTGCGIAPEEISRIFERFYRCAGTSAEQRGAGLGLAICESLIKHQGGRIWVESVRGEGSRFYFTLPVADTTSN
ncbi:ATP-binding protein [Petrachloros mirabilis]